MVKRDFDAWLSKFRASISGYRYYIDFDKVVRNVEDIKIELNILNSLIGSVNIEDDFEKIITKISGNPVLYSPASGCAEQRNLCPG